MSSITVFLSFPMSTAKDSAPAFTAFFSTTCAARSLKAENMCVLWCNLERVSRKLLYQSQFLIFNLHSLMLYVCGGMHPMVYLWRSEKNLQKSILFLHFYRVGSRNQTQVVSLGGKHLYLMSHFFSPYFFLCFVFQFLLFFFLSQDYLIKSYYCGTGRDVSIVKGTCCSFR